MKQLPIKLWSLLAILFASTTFSFAQNDSWCVVMTKAGHPESYDHSSSFPSDFISKQWKKGQYITEMTYDGTNWWAVTSDRPGFTQQTYKRSKSFPNDFIDTKWGEGFDITSVEYGANEWVVIMTKGAGYSGETWGKRGSFEEIKNFIKTKWNDQKDIIDITYGNGEWVAVLAYGADYDKQTYHWSSEFPSSWVNEKHTQGYNITSLTYGEGQWIVVMSKYSTARSEQYFTAGYFPSKFIEQQWSAGKRISFLHYNYEKDLNASFDEFMAAGNEAANKNDHDLAIYYYTEAIKVRPNDATAYNNRAWSKYLLEQCQGALTDVSKSISLAANEFNYHTRGAINLCLGRCHDASNDFAKAIQKATKKDAFYYGDHGLALECLGDYDAAIAEYKKALSIDPNNKTYRSALAVVEDKVNESAPPTVTWDYPYKSYAASDQPNYNIKACIHSKSDIAGIQVFVNGKSFNSRGFGVEDDCTESVNQDIKLQPGKNVVEIVVKTSKHTTRSEKRTIEYKAKESSGNYHALIIAVENYDDFSIRDLEKPIEDAEKLQEVLTKEYTFEPGDVHMLKNPTKEQILEKLIYLQEHLDDDDNLLVYYSGHGIVKNDVGYWLPSNAKNDSRIQWLSNAEIRDYMNGMEARHTLIIADACFSGSIFTGGFRDFEEFACEEMAKLKSRRAMTSGANTVVPDNSVFFKYLVKKLEENNASCLSAENLYSKIKPAVIYNSPNNHVPQFGVLPQVGDEGGNFVFKRRK
jgi:tetratricopeptide (TPR) repeat protein